MVAPRFLNVSPRMMMPAAAAVALAGGALASPDVGDVDQHIRQLEARIAELEANQGETWMTEARATEIRSLVQEVLTDADTRASLLQGGTSAGWDNGFFMASADGNFRLNVSGQQQFRYVFNSQDDLAGPDGSRGGFENRRTKLIFSGNVIDPTILYRIEGNFDFSGGLFFLQDAWIGKAYDENWTFLAGQMKVPFQREFLVDSSMQQAVERSLVSAEFDSGRTQGVAADYRNDWFHATGAFTDGHPATGGFNMPALMVDTEFSLTGRAEVMLAGEWSQFNDQTSWKGEDFAFMVGGAVHYQEGESGTSAPTVDVLQWTIDATAEFGGANIFGYVVGRDFEVAGGANLEQIAAVIQGGFFVTDDWEIFGRYEWGDDDTSSEDLSIITIGATKYMSKHQLKWTSDIGFGLEGVSSTFGTGFLGTGGGGAGWRTDSGTEDGQIVVRTQLQLLF